MSIRRWFINLTPPSAHLYVRLALDIFYRVNVHTVLARVPLGKLEMFDRVICTLHIFNAAYTVFT